MKTIRIRKKNKTQFIISENDFDWGVLPLANLPFFIDVNSGEQEIDEDDFKLLFEEIRKYAWNRLLDYLALRERSRRESLDYLMNLPVEAELTNELVQRAESKKFISDTRFAELYTESLLHRQKSREEIRYKLKEKGIDEILIDQTLAKIVTPEQEADVIDQKIDKLLVRYRDLKPKQQIEKILTSLCRNGFSYEDVKDKVRMKVYAGK